MIRAVLADTGPLYAANDEGDEYHERALRELQKLARDRREIVVPYPVLTECYSLILFRLGRRAALEWLAEMAEASFVNPGTEDYRGAFARVRALADQKITITDATVATLASRLELEVWTYDHDFDAMRVKVWQ